MVTPSMDGMVAREMENAQMEDMTKRIQTATKLVRAVHQAATTMEQRKKTKDQKRTATRKTGRK